MMTGMSLIDSSDLHSLRIDQPSLPGIRTSNRISFGIVSRIMFKPCSPFVAPNKVNPAFFIVLFTRSCIAISSSMRTHKFSPAKALTSSFSKSSASSQILGIKIVKTDPLPFSDETVTPPPISSANLFEIGRPRPVPP